MIISIIWFAASFLVIFPPCLALSRALTEKSRKMEDRRFWEDGQRRRAEAAAADAWLENKETDLR
jgi:hypothetical protein